MYLHRTWNAAHSKLPYERTLSAGELSCAISLEGHPVQGVVATISSTSKDALEGAVIQIQGDQLYASSLGCSKLQVMLPFGVDGSKAKGQMQGEQIIVKMQYAPLQSVWAS